MTKETLSSKLNAAAMTYKAVMIIALAIIGGFAYLSNAVNETITTFEEVIVTTKESAKMTIDLEYDKKIKGDGDIKPVKLPFISKACGMSYSQTDKYKEKCACLLFNQSCQYVSN